MKMRDFWASIFAIIGLISLLYLGINLAIARNWIGVALLIIFLIFVDVTCEP